jgi:endonuclease IV
MVVGAHVSTAGDVVANVARMVDAHGGATAVQIFTHGPQSDRANLGAPERAALATYVATSGVALYIHSSYLTNPWPSNEGGVRAMRDRVWTQMTAARECGARGLVVHLPKNTAGVIAAGLAPLLEGIRRMAPVILILEMKAVTAHPTKSYETWAKLAALAAALEAVGFTNREVRFCVDTAHIAAGRAAIRSAADATAWLVGVDPAWMELLHLNGNEYDGAVRAGDKHTVPGGAADTIWRGVEWADSGCRVFVEWFRANGLQAVLEMKDGHAGPELDALVARLG